MEKDQAGKEKKVMGRPKIELDYKLIERLANIQCTQEEIAGAIGVCVKTLQRDDEFCRIYKNARDGGKMSLRRVMMKLALGGNATMLVWLSKQYLGMKDKAEVDNTHEVVIEVNIEEEDE